MTTEHTIVIATIEYHPGPFTLEIETPTGGLMLLKPDHYLVTDQNGDRWVFTRAQLKAVGGAPDRN